MALKSCTECGSKISTHAKICPSCGKPQTTTAKRLALWIWASAFGIFAITIMNADKTPPKTATSETTETNPAPSSDLTTDTQMVKQPAANERAADSVECKAIIARLIEATNASFDHYSPSGDNVFLKSPDFLVSCTNHRLTGVSLSWDESGYPPNRWFDLVAKAAKALTGVELKKLQAAIRKCHQMALKDKTEIGDLDIPNAKIECQAFTRDGGGVYMSVLVNDHEARKGIEDPE